QTRYGEAPRYYLLDEQGPDNCKCFKVAAAADGHQFPPAWGRNKKEAELKAALNGLAELTGQPLPHPSN
ncbi:MAG TPA: putative dsRNA-binding protein, partial [Urbifossiella sp.]|nr:putative dsRNA-binding protein [Urbifossiella sp.]